MSVCVLCLYVCLYNTYMAGTMTGQKRWATEDSELPCGLWESNPDPFDEDEKKVLLTHQAIISPTPFEILSFIKKYFPGNYYTLLLTFHEHRACTSNRTSLSSFS